MRYIVVILLLVSIVSCNCERELVCDSGVTTIEGDQELLDSIWMLLPNILLAEESFFNIVYIEHAQEIQDVKIESYFFEMSIKNEVFYETSNLDFISMTDRLRIPKDSLFAKIDMPVEYANYKLRLHFVGKEGFIGVARGEVILADCESVVSGEIGDADCRHSYDLIPSFESPPFICM